MKRKIDGFSLIELMIVIVIIGIVYTLAFIQYQGSKENSIKPDIGNLKEYLVSYLKEDGNSSKLLCLDNCEICSIYVDDKKVSDIDVFFKDKIEIYSYNSINEIEIEELGNFFSEDGIEKDICFSFEVDKNMVSDQVFIINGGKVYDYTNYFEKVKIFNSIDELKEEKENIVKEVLNNV